MANFLDHINDDSEASSLTASVPAKLPMMEAQAPKERKVYLMQSLAAVLNDPRYEEDNLKQGQFFVEGDPNGEPGTDNAKGYGVKILEALVRDYKYSRDFRSKNKPICWSPDGKTGRPSADGRAAPYNIPQNQDCMGCIWRRKDTAIDSATNGYCSLVRNIQVVVPDRTGRLTTAWFSFKNTAGGVGDRLIQMYTERIRDGQVKPFPVKFSSKKPEKAAYFVPEVEAVE